MTEDKDKGLALHRWLQYINTLFLGVACFFLVRLVDQVDRMSENINTLQLSSEHQKSVEATVNAINPKVQEHEVRITVLESENKFKAHK